MHESRKGIMTRGHEERIIMDNTENNQIEEAVFEELDAKENKDDSTSFPVYPTQVVLSIRAIVGAYLMYLAYQIITSDSEITTLMWVAVGIFILAGAALVIMSVKHFICGEYEGGKKDENR